jgi:alkanesulfonate monooxygenase SsuD/methylene tetrahydromethanopterin reductase-like flavin-dependent oxidoreductase (luciferase family)
MSRPIKIGIMLPESEREMAGLTARWNDFLEMGQTIETLGFDSLWFADHLLMKVEGHEPQGAWEAMSILAALAASTERITLAPFVAATAYRNPALTAKIAETIDEISGGRFILGLGSGWARPEYDAFGYPYDHRASRFEEAIQIITSLIRTGTAEFVGDYHFAINCELRPRGPRPNGLPIMVGTFDGERMMRLAAQFADHWNVWATVTNNSAATVPQLQAKMDEICRSMGRQPDTLERSVAVLVDFDGAYGRPGQKDPSLTGTPREIADEFLRYAEAGVDHLQIYPDPCTVEGIHQVAEAMALLDADS